VKEEEVLSDIVRSEWMDGWMWKREEKRGGEGIYIPIYTYVIAD